MVVNFNDLLDMIRTFTKFSRSTPSYGSFNKRIGKSWSRQGWRDGRLGKLHLGLVSFILGSTWGQVRQAICLNHIYSTRQYWQGSISKKACIRISILRASSWGFLLGFWQSVWCLIGEKWCISWWISWRCCLTSARGHSRFFSWVTCL